MAGFWNDFVLTFVPLFIVIDAFGNLPFLLATQFPTCIVLIPFALNMLIAWVIFLLGNRIARFLGDAGIRVISRVFSLLLAAIGVSMILRGLDMTGIVELAD